MCVGVESTDKFDNHTLAVDCVEFILRTFINEMNKHENRFGKLRDEEMMHAVKKLMFEISWRWRTSSSTRLHQSR